MSSRSELAGFCARAFAVLAKDWRTELRSRYALNSLALFAFSTLVTVSMALGPIGSSDEAESMLPVVLWLILLFAATAGLPRTFVGEEETHTAIALRLSAEPEAVFAGKLGFALTLTFALEILVVPLFLAMTDLVPKQPGLFVATLLAGGFGLAAGSTLVAAMVAQARGKGTLFAVLLLPILVPLLVMAVALTRAAVSGEPPLVEITQVLLYDGMVTIGGFLLFPPVWNP